MDMRDMKWVSGKAEWGDTRRAA